MIISCVSACQNGGEASESSETSGTVSKDTTSESTETTDTESETTADTESETEDTEGTATEPDEIYPIFSNKKTKFSIVVPDYSYEEISDIADDMKITLNSVCDVSIPIRDTSSYLFLYGEDPFAPKIIIGSNGAFPETIDIRMSLPKDEFTIRFENNTLYIIGYNNTATESAWEYFKATYLNSSAAELKFENGFKYDSNMSEKLNSMKINGNDISLYKIIYYNSVYAQECATDIQKKIAQKTGAELPILSDVVEPSEYEILIGKTNRAESQAVRGEYDRPNIYYDITTKGNKLVLMAEGYTTLAELTASFRLMLDARSGDVDIVGSVVSGDVNNTSMIDKTDGTDVRVMAWNMGGPGTWGKLDLAEKLADTILKNLPDVFGTNEFYNPEKGAYRTTYDRVIKDISEYYYEIESDNDFPDDERIPSFTQNRGPRPQKIYIRKDSGIKVIAAGWRYTEYQKDVDYRSFPWAVLETKVGDKFIYTVSHYTDMTSDTAAAIEQLEAVAYAQEQSGCSETLPAILSGDIWMSRGKGSYKYFTDAGYMDAQREAIVNANGNISHGTFHEYGKLVATGGIPDRMMYTAGLTALQFKVITSKSAMDSSDHYPLMCDFKFQ